MEKQHFIKKEGRFIARENNDGYIIELKDSKPGSKPGRSQEVIFRLDGSRVSYTACEGCYITTVVTPYAYGEMEHYKHVEQFNELARKAAALRLGGAIA